MRHPVWFKSCTDWTSESINSVVGYLFLIVMYYEWSNSRFSTICLCKWGILEVNYVFSLGHFQWCICKYEDGPCLDFSGGMLTVFLSFSR